MRSAVSELMHQKAFGLWALAALAVGCQEMIATEAVNRRESAIVNGQPDDGHPATGRLTIRLAGGATASCTGTLAGGRTVLTAAHCVKDDPAATSVTFAVGGRSYQADSWAAHPSYASGGVHDDVAVIKLKESPYGIQPATLAARPPAAGQAIAIVGFGKTAMSKASDGVKRIAHNTIDSVTADRFFYSGATGDEGLSCVGDSGGPVFSTVNGQELQIGISSYGTGSDCAGTAGAVRVDAYLEWILEQAGDDILSDNVAPDLAILSPTADSPVPSSFIVRAETVDEGTGVAELKLYVDGKLAESASDIEEDKILLAVEDVAPGMHTLRLEAKDYIGNLASATSTVTVDDTLSPKVTILSPAAGETVPAGFSVQVQAQDEGGAPAVVQLFVDGKAWPLPASSEEVGETTAFHVSELAPGPHELWAAVKDSAGNVGYAQMTIKVDATLSPERCMAANGTACELSDALVGGCTVAAGAELHGAWPLLGLLLVGCFARRRLRR